MSESKIRGGQVWEQPGFPHCSCYLVYLGPDWCRIQTPDLVGNIAMTNEQGKWQYTTEEMEALLDRLGYELVGQFADAFGE